MEIPTNVILSRDQLIDALPTLANKIFQCRYRAVNGSYANLARGLGHLLYSVHDFETHYTITRMMIDQTLFLELVSGVAKFE